MSDVVENKDNKKNYVPELNVFRISQIPYCSKGIYFSKTRPQDAKELSYKQKGRFLLGHLVHDFLEKKFKRFAISTEKLVKYHYKNIVIQGHIDIELPNKVLDVKTVNERSFQYRWMDERPSYHHYLQANSYAVINGSEYVSILYICIVDFAYVERVLTATKSAFDVMCQKAQTIYECIQNGIIPKPDWVEDWECSYCDFNHICDTVNRR